MEWERRSAGRWIGEGPTRGSKIGARAQVSTLRTHLLKLSARLEQSVRRIVVHLPQSFAYLNEWTRIARKLGAVPS